MRVKIERNSWTNKLDKLDENKMYLGVIRSTNYLFLTAKENRVLFIPLQEGSSWTQTVKNSVSFDEYYEITDITLKVSEV